MGLILSGKSGEKLGVSKKTGGELIQGEGVCSLRDCELQ